ncbi:hypothetical protein FN846DRAFT_44385 [Sphaerosporella brunnea]|uniref:Succinate dehydrogenase cytochrome b560 subunit n=1 Tax=Sphaerosporella brunnea TaxID=1250544 RepID=A0A5J5EVX8_9PEZI|nr:hypothetical protein FN846DRAFT_44385 [Sphaerosporella brunnea]
MAFRTIFLRRSLQPFKHAGLTPPRITLTAAAHQIRLAATANPSSKPLDDLVVPLPKPRDELTTPMLEAQRRHRPLTPHLSIYQPQLTWYMSAFHRLTGLFIGGTLYAYLGAYAVAPWMGWHVDTNTLASMVASWPVVVKYVGKFCLAFPATYYFLDTIRHEIWNFGYCLDLKDVYRTGYAVLAGTAVGTIWLMFFM